MNLYLRFFVLLALGLALIAFLPGCAVLGDRRVAAGCQIADGATSYYALTHGAVERNPILAGSNPGAILLVHVLFAWIVYKVLPPVEKADSGSKFVSGVVAVSGCGLAGHNLQVIRTLR